MDGFPRNAIQRRLAGPVNPTALVPPDKGTIGLKTGVGPAPVPVPTSPEPGFGPNFRTPAPGVSGITSGAVERRLGPSIPPTAQLAPGRLGVPPTDQARVALGNTIGTNPQAIQNPLLLIQQLLRSGRLGE